MPYKSIADLPDSVRDITDRVRVEQREADAAARALLLQEVTAELVRAWTLDQVEHDIGLPPRLRAVGDDG